MVIYSSDNKIIRQSFNPGIWEENPNELSLKIPCSFTPAAIEIQTGIFVDKFDGDNVLIF